MRSNFFFYAVNSRLGVRTEDGHLRGVITFLLKNAGTDYQLMTSFLLLASLAMSVSFWSP